MTSTEAPLWCVVPAAGRGARVGGGIPKQYLPIHGKPLLLHTLERLATHSRVAGLMVVLAPDDPHWPGLTDVVGKPLRIAIGGEHRADSVLAGLHALRELVDDATYVLVHDAARPCVAHDDISRLIDLGIPAGGALLATPLSDTLKRADADNRVVATEPRESRWRALTPQLFRLGELAGALESARDSAVTATDEAMAMELTGAHPLLVPGSGENIKVTTRADFALAEFLLGRRET